MHMCFLGIRGPPWHPEGAVWTGGVTIPTTHPAARRMVNETDIVELELKSKRFNLSVKKQEALRAEQPTVQARAPLRRCTAAH
jgi:hypothetical protein